MLFQLKKKEYETTALYKQMDRRTSLSTLHTF